MRQRMLRGQNLLCPRRRRITSGSLLAVGFGRFQHASTFSCPTQDRTGRDMIIVRAAAASRLWWIRRAISRSLTRARIPRTKKGRVPGMWRRIVLGTDFRTDIALFSLPLDSPFRVRAGNDETASALRTICEALAKAACRVLQIESTEILAEYRPALTDAGANGLETEVFIYDTLAGGAGFSPQLVRDG